jgi:dTDP-4-dehydrorhamnose reductase
VAQADLVKFFKKDLRTLNMIFYFLQKKILIFSNLNLSTGIYPKKNLGIGTANVTKACSKLNIKLIYISTCYVYPGSKGNYSETSPLLPINNYAWSKLGGESSVQMYKNSLILRASITEKPFVHPSAFTDFKTNFIFHEDLIESILKIKDEKGVINIGGKSQSVYNFVKKYNKKIKKISARNMLGKKTPINITMNINKFKKLTND